MRTYHPPENKRRKESDTAPSRTEADASFFLLEREGGGVVLWHERRREDDALRTDRLSGYKGATEILLFGLLLFYCRACPVYPDM